MKGKTIKFLFLFFFIIPYSLNAQNENIFPGLKGQQLLDSLVADYKTSSVYSYDKARDTLFANIYKHNDSLTCVYTNYTIYLNPSLDPTTDAYNKGINTEHTWPQSKGAVDQAKSDMHHLYPTKSNVNSSRGNDPFAESLDHETDKWYRLEEVLTSVPILNINEYSEKDNDADVFEPREDHKGNVARSMFYFYTMYKTEADSYDPNFFSMQKDVLYQWHYADPVDSNEKQRNELIAFYQDGKKNPFIADTTLVSRAYFLLNPVESNENVKNPSEFSILQNYPNPFNSSTVIEFTLQEKGIVELSIFNSKGDLVEILLKEHMFPGFHIVNWKPDNHTSGLYFARLMTENYSEIIRLAYIK